MMGLSAARTTAGYAPVGRSALRGVVRPAPYNAEGGRREAEADRAADAVRTDAPVPGFGTARGASGAARASAPPNSTGMPLASALRHDMERRFGADFAQVRVHADGPAAQATQRRNARAYADGDNLVFGAGEYQPGSPAGRQLLAHELAHVLQQREGAQRFQRKPLTYDPTAITIAPPSKQLTLVEAQAMTQDAVSKGELTAATVSGAKKGSNEEIMLHYILASTGQKSRWGTEVDLVTAIDFATPPSPAPVGKVTVRIDDKGAGSAELVSTGAVVTPAAYTKLEDAKKALISAPYGFAEVKDDTSTWTLDELNIVIGALKRVPTTDLPALKGVTLLRVSTLTGSSGDLSGEFSFNQGLSGTSNTVVTDDATLALADSVFPTTQVNFTGAKTDAAPAGYLTVLHEIGHAVENMAVRKTTNAQNKATAATNKLMEEREPLAEALETERVGYNTSVDDYNALDKEATDLKAELAAAKKGGDKTAIKAAQDAYDAKIKERAAKQTEVTANKAKYDKAKVPDQAKAAQIKTASATQKTAEKTAEDATARSTLLTRANTAGGTAKAALTRAKSNVNAATADSADYRKAADDAGIALADFAKGVTDRAEKVGDMRSAADTAVQNAETERNNLETANASDPALAAYAPVVTAQRAWFDALALVLDLGDQSLRLRKFIDFVTANKIEPFTKYASDNWPNNPGEFFAEAYSLFLSDPEYLKKNSPALHGWFAGGQYR